MLHVGTVIVVEERDRRQVPVDILTDRDIILSIVALNAEHLPFLSVSDAMKPSGFSARVRSSLSSTSVVTTACSISPTSP
jgi:hypothetical protein